MVYQLIKRLKKFQLSNMIQFGRCLSRIFEPLLKTVLNLIGNLIKALAKRVLVPLELMAAASATDAKVFSYEDLNDIIKIF